MYLVLHPRHKLVYFKSTKWEQNWIDTAEALVREEFERSYADLDAEGEDEHEEDEGISESTGILVSAPPIL